MGMSHMWKDHVGAGREPPVREPPQHKLMNHFLRVGADPRVGPKIEPSARSSGGFHARAGGHTGPPLRVFCGKLAAASLNIDSTTDTDRANNPCFVQ
jgi:hypothetical protein